MDEKKTRVKVTVFKVMLILKDKLVMVGSLDVYGDLYKRGDIDGEKYFFSTMLHEEAVLKLIDMGYIKNPQEGRNLLEDCKFLLLPYKTLYPSVNESKGPGLENVILDDLEFEIISKSKGINLCSCTDDISINIKDLF